MAARVARRQLRSVGNQPGNELIGDLVIDDQSLGDMQIWP
jgi:hypothetical protein